MQGLSRRAAIRDRTISNLFPIFAKRQRVRPHQRQHQSNHQCKNGSVHGLMVSTVFLLGKMGKYPPPRRMAFGLIGPILTIQVLPGADAERDYAHSRVDVHEGSDHPESNQFVDGYDSFLTQQESENIRIKKKHLKVVLLDLYVAWLDDLSFA